MQAEYRDENQVRLYREAPRFNLQYCCTLQQKLYLPAVHHRKTLSILMNIFILPGGTCPGLLWSTTPLRRRNPNKRFPSREAQQAMIYYLYNLLFYEYSSTYNRYEYAPPPREIREENIVKRHRWSWLTNRTNRDNRGPYQALVCVYEFRSLASQFA